LLLSDSDFRSQKAHAYHPTLFCPASLMCTRARRPKCQHRRFIETTWIACAGMGTSSSQRCVTRWTSTRRAPAPDNRRLPASFDASPNNSRQTTASPAGSREGRYGWILARCVCGGLRESV
jgi:hypothetical protein